MAKGELHSVQGSGLEWNAELRAAYAELAADQGERARRRRSLKERRRSHRASGGITENQFARRMVRGHLVGKGWRVTKRGWPDFFCFNEETGEILLVEVKPTKSVPLMDSQLKIARALKRYGVPVRRWSPDVGLEEIADEDVAPGGPGPRLQRKRYFA